MASSSLSPSASKIQSGDLALASPSHFGDPIPNPIAQTKPNQTKTRPFPSSDDPAHSQATSRADPTHSPPQFSHQHRQPESPFLAVVQPACDGAAGPPHEGVEALADLLKRVRLVFFLCFDLESTTQKKKKTQSFFLYY